MYPKAMLASPNMHKTYIPNSTKENNWFWTWSCFSWNNVTRYGVCMYLYMVVKSCYKYEDIYGSQCVCVRVLQRLIAYPCRWQPSNCDFTVKDTGGWDLHPNTAVHLSHRLHTCWFTNPTHCLQLNYGFSWKEFTPWCKSFEQLFVV